MTWIGRARGSLGITVFTLALVAAAARPAVAAHGGPRFDPPKRYYLALGDSITYGFQSVKFDAGLPPTAFDTGYVDVLTARLRTIRPDLAVINYGCPGESTTTFIVGPCVSNTIGLALHTGFAGSQIDAATKFLRTHPGQVSPITLHLFGNDINDFVRACAGDFDCIRRDAPVAIAQFAARLSVILGALRAAAPDSEIIAVGGWNSSLDGLGDTDPLFQAANAAIAAAATEHRAVFADMAAVFNPPGDQARTATLCALTLYCTDGDSHPSDAGYRAIAEAVYDASRYTRLEPASQP